MPYSKDELDNLPFYQELITGDESKYLEMIEKRTESGTLGKTKKNEKIIIIIK